MTPFESGTDHPQHDPWRSPVLVLAQIPKEWWGELRQLLEFETGMELSGARSSRLREAVSNVVRKQRLSPGLLLDPEAHSQFVENVAAELTVGESFFLRNEHHMQILRRNILPRIHEENLSRRDIRIWSAGCACGEEPYSLSILLKELQIFQNWQVSILGTDLNPAFLEKARVGTYRNWSFRHSRIQHDPRFFSRVPGGYQIREPLRKNIRFQYLNLAKDIYPSGLNGTLGLDLILFRNVAIYLRQEVTAAILERMYQALRPGGWLLLGEIEVALAPEIGFEVHRFANVTIHRKPVDAPSSTMWLPPVSSLFSPPRKRPVIPRSGTRSLSERTDASPSSAGLTGTEPSEIPPAPELPEESAVIQPVQEVSPHLFSGRLQYVWFLLQQAQVDLAREQLRMAIAEDPLCIEAWLLQGGLEEDAGELEPAELSYRRALYLDRDCPLIHFHLGLVLQQQGNREQGQQSLKTALQLAARHPPDELVRHGDGVCYGRLHEMALMLTGESDE